MSNGIGITNEIREAAADFEKRFFCEKHGAVDLDLGFTPEISEEKLSAYFLGLIGIDSERYNCVFDAFGYFGLIKCYRNLDDLGDAYCTLGFRILDRESGDCTDKESVRLHLTKVLGIGEWSGICPADEENFAPISAGREEIVKNALSYRFERKVEKTELQKLSHLPGDKGVFYFVRDGKAVTTIIRPTLSSEKELKACDKLREKIFELTGRLVRIVGDYSHDITGSPVLFSNTIYFDHSILGTAITPEYVIHLSDCALSLVGRSNGGTLDSVDRLIGGLVCENGGKDLYITSDLPGVYRRELPPTEHAFKKFTVSLYGCPYNREYHKTPKQRLEDEKTFNYLVDFGAMEVPFRQCSVSDPDEVRGNRQLFEKFLSKGITVRPYFGFHRFFEEFKEGKTEGIEDFVKRVVAAYGDCEAVSHWGFCDEPQGRVEDAFCGKVRELLKKYDPKKRPVYINLGPEASAEHRDSMLNFYDDVTDYCKLDYYCFDRYPYFTRNGIDGVYDDDYYYNLEINRAYAVDNGRDTGMIFAAIKVGGDPNEDRSDVNDDMMRWQSNLLLAYGYRYYEQYVYYYAHEYSILDKNNDPTHRWYRAQKANAYLALCGKELENTPVDMVWHLPNKDGGYSNGTAPYPGFRGLGKVGGCDAILSFLHDGTLIVTDKRVDENNGEFHSLTFEGLKADDGWFDPSCGKWKKISDCPGAEFDGKICTLAMPRACQYIFRAGRFASAE